MSSHKPELIIEVYTDCVILIHPNGYRVEYDTIELALPYINSYLWKE